MKVEHTSDSPILLKLIPETPLEAFENGIMAIKLLNMKIPQKVKDDATLLLNIDPTWSGFTEHGEDKDESE